MSKANIYEQFMLELINAERAKVGVQPLAFDGDLNESSENHSNWIISTDTFSHRGIGGSSPGDRMEAAGFEFTGNWTWGENIARMSTRGPEGLEDEVQQLHTNLMDSPGHRANLLNNAFREIGVGFEVGQFGNFENAVVTQNFARTASDFFLTGVVFNDKDNDKGYDINEGLPGVKVSAKNHATDAIVTTITNGGGGYNLEELINGIYTVSFSGNGVDTTSKQVSINNRNKKLDLKNPDSDGTPVPTPTPTPTPEPELNTIIGTSRSDSLRGTSGDDEILGLGGNDRLFGADGNDHIDGGSGNDRMFGADGNDHIDGGRGRDKIYGGADADILTGGKGRDYFVFNTPFDNTVDTIVDFSERDDRIVLENAVFTGLHRGRLDSSDFHIGAKAKDTNDHIIYHKKTGFLYFDVDGAGGADAIQFAELTSGLTLNHTDFLII